VLARRLCSRWLVAVTANFIALSVSRFTLTPDAAWAGLGWAALVPFYADGTELSFLWWVGRMTLGQPGPG